ncbi:MAG: type II secretion system protein [bacterium]|nr:type II secretion system protein [bacterium]
MKKNPGFTLIEILVVLGISIILAMGGLFSLSNLRKHQSLRLASEGMVAFLRDAQQRSVSQDGGLGWGVHFDNSASERDSYWRFSGVDPLIASEKVAIAPGVELETSSDNVFFSKVSGLPDSATVVKVKLSNDPATFRTITINAQGTIEQK